MGGTKRLNINVGTASDATVLRYVGLRYICVYNPFLVSLYILRKFEGFYKNYHSNLGELRHVLGAAELVAVVQGILIFILCQIRIPYLVSPVKMLEVQLLLYER